MQSYVEHPYQGLVYTKTELLGSVSVEKLIIHVYKHYLPDDMSYFPELPLKHIIPEI